MAATPHPAAPPRRVPSTRDIALPCLGPVTIIITRPQNLLLLFLPSSACPLPFLYLSPLLLSLSPLPLLLYSLVSISFLVSSIFSVALIFLLISAEHLSILSSFFDISFSPLLPLRHFSFRRSARPFICSSYHHLFLLLRGSVYSAGTGCCFSTPR